MEFTAKVKSITKKTKETSDDEETNYITELEENGSENPKKIKIVETSSSFHVGDTVKIKTVEEQKTLKPIK